MAMPYCPAPLLGSFALLMAGHGRCVSTAMMLGDRQYAREQLEAARALGDEEIGGVVLLLEEYFEDALASA